MHQFHELVEKLEQEMSKIGLHMQGSTILTDNPELESAGDNNPESIDPVFLINEKKAAFAVNATFLVGDLAFDERIVNPQAFEEDQIFKTALPSESEMIHQTLLDDISNWNLEFDEDE